MADPQVPISPEKQAEHEQYLRDIEDDYKSTIWAAAQLAKFHGWCGSHRLVPTAQAWRFWWRLARFRERLDRMKEIGAPASIIASCQSDVNRCSGAFLSFWLFGESKPRRQPKGSQVEQAGEKESTGVV